jgi:PAS domain S-box-containing protein
MDPITIILTASCLISAFITFGLGIAVYVKNPKSAVNRLFLLAMLAASYWAVGEFLIWQSTESPEAVWFWLKMSSLWPFVVALTVHCILTITNPPPFAKHKYLTLAIIYLPAGLISAILFFTSWIFTVARIEGTSYSYLPVRSSLAYQVETLYIFLMMLFAAGVIFSFWQSATTKKVKNQAFLIGTAISTVIFFGALSGILLPAFSIYTPNLVFIGLVIFSVLITIAIQKHELFILSPTTAVPDILRTMPDAMVLSDMNGVIISANESAGKIFSVEGKALPGMSVAAIVPEEAFTRIRSAVLQQGTIADLETTPQGRRSGTVSIAGSRVQAPNGEPAGIVLIVRDITDRKTTETALRIAGEKIALLTRITRHDINNLISALSGYLLLLKENPGDPASEFYVASCMQITEKIHNQIQFTREYQDMGSHEPVWQPLEHILFRTISDLSHGKIAITQSVADVEILADPLIVKVIYNLLENAIRHGGHITRIQISSEQLDDQTLRIIIQDDGVGIKDEDRSRIFQYGFGRNTGFGLALSRDILSLTGITITETGSAGAGARFELCVPASAWRSHDP